MEVSVLKLFISWSGEFSQRVAEKLRIWIPTIIQSVEVFYSPKDIAKGENWSNRLFEELDNCSFGIVCLTPENVAAPWIHFEAGALSASLKARISAIMLSVSPSDVKGPLAHYQNTAFNREDFFRLFQSINDSCDTPLKAEILSNAFDHAWESLKAEIEEIIKIYRASKEKTTVEIHGASDSDSDSDSDALQEILRLVRKMDGVKTMADTKSIRYSIDPGILKKVVVFPNKADPSDVFAIVCKYVPDERRLETKHQLHDGSPCGCLVPKFDVEELISHLDKIGAVGCIMD